MSLNISDWWLSLYINNAMQLDIHVGVIGGVLLIVAGVILFRRTRRQMKLDNSLALLGAVYAKGKPEKFRH
jgi:hypothetical protein